MKKLDYSTHYSIYHNHSDEEYLCMSEWFWNELKHFNIKTSKSTRVLDIGCGTGFFLNACKKLGMKHIKGIDNSIEQIEQCKKKNIEAILVKSALDFLSKDTDTYDLITAFDVIEHLPKNELLDTTHLIYERLSSEGSFILQVPNAKSIIAPGWLYNDITHNMSFTNVSIEILLKNAGFSTVIIANKPTYKPPFNKMYKVFNNSEYRRDLFRWVYRKVWEKIIEIEFNHPPTNTNLNLETNLLVLAKK